MKRIDTHVHTALQDYSVDGVVHISGAEKMIGHMKTLGIDHAILMASGEQNTLMPVGDNEECREICARYPAYFHWMCNISDTDESTLEERLMDYKQQGCVGIGELIYHKPLSDPFFQVLFSYAQKLGLPVLFHMSSKEGYQYGVVDEAGLPLLEQVLQQYPDLVMIGHSQPFWYEISKNQKNDYESRYTWGEGKVEEGGRLPHLLQKYPNLYCDLSANSGGCALMRDEAFGTVFIRRFHEQLLFGTDMVNTAMTFPLAEWLDTQYHNGAISKVMYENIFSNNAKRLFNL